MTVEQLSGTSRDTDPFTYGIAHIDDGKATENMLVNMFKRNMIGRVQQENSEEEKVQSILSFIREHGRVSTVELQYKFDKLPPHVKHILTYRDVVYESDDGYWIGILGPDLEPLPRKAPIQYVTKPTEGYPYKITDNGQVKYYKTLAVIEREYGIDYHVLASLMKGKKNKRRPYLQLEKV